MLLQMRCITVKSVKSKSMNCEREVPRAAAGLGLMQATCCSLLCPFIKGKDKAW